MAEPSSLPNCRDQVVDRMPGQRGITLGDEQPRQTVVSAGEVALKRAQLITTEPMLRRQRALEAGHP
jgi:hypothetical protein